MQLGLGVRILAGVALVANVTNPAKGWIPQSPQTTNRAQNLIANGDFAKWTEDGPANWTVSVGAKNGGNAPRSIVRQGEDSALELHGDASTRAWHLVAQSADVQPGDVLRLRYQVRTANIRREGSQFDNCYVGIFWKDAQGKNVSQNIWPSNATEYAEVKKMFRVPREATQAQLTVFLSKSGTLSVKEFGLHRLRPEESFQVLIDDMDRYYSHFEIKQVDWNSLTEKYRGRAEAAESADAFAEVVAEMLAELKDVHTWAMYGGKRYAKYRSSFSPNYDFSVVDRGLSRKKPIGSFGLVGITNEGFGYVRVSSLSGIDAKTLRHMLEAVRSLLDRPGIIVDLRRNGGGAEPVAAQIAALFATEPVVYGRQRFRSGPQHTDFYDAGQRTLGPAQGGTYDGKIVCLIGPGAVSSAEGFAMMMKAIPGCTVIGQPTRGASGNPAPVHLPNGVDVWYSRWLSLMPDGTPIEDAGVTPDVLVQHGEGDPTWQKALAILNQAQ